MRKRTRAREICLLTMYQVELLQKFDELDVLEKFADNLEFFQAKDMKDYEESISEFGKDLLFGVLPKFNHLDELIGKYCINWTIDRINNLDKCILRLALFEILFREDIPRKVSINEAIDLAKMYTDDKSAKFVNGLLDRVIKNELKGK